MKYLRWIILLAGLLLSAEGAFAQGKVNGKVFDKNEGSAVEYASVALLKTSDSSLVSGNVTLTGGEFELTKVPYGTYILRITMMGYKPYFHPETVTISSGKSSVNVGKIVIAQTSTMLKAAEITAERSMVEYQLDKRVINVDKNIVTGGGTATDVLEQVPSVAIDNDGNVTLRGSTNVKVLINGRPYELMGSDLDILLEQIPASSIENVEVITNPSAKYDPEGMSGIINLKLKDQTAGALGLNGTINVNVGAPMPFLIPDGNRKFIPTSMGTINLNYSTKKFNVFFNADGGLRSRANTSTSYIRRMRNGATISEDSITQFGWNANTMSNVKLGAEWFINDQNSILFSYQLSFGRRSRKTNVFDHDVLNDGLLDYHQTDTNNTDRFNQIMNLLYTKKFDNPGQTLVFDMTYTHRMGRGRGNQVQLYDLGSVNFDNYYQRLTRQKRGGDNFDIKLDYTHPFGKNYRLETGYEGIMNFAGLATKYDIVQYDMTYNLFSRRDDKSSIDEDYNQQIHAVYATFGGKWFDCFSAQVGLRGEYSLIKGIDYNHSDDFSVNKHYWQFYPTVHLSYDINKEQSIQLSYSKRVRRPRMQSLDAFLNVREGMEMDFGNPNLDPEYTHALELSYNVGFKYTNIFASAYFRQTNKMMTRYGFVWNEDNVDYYSPWMVYNSAYEEYWASTWQNLNKGLNYGLELIWDQRILKWWKINISMNFYGSYIEGTELLHNTSQKSFRVSGKMSSYMNLPKDWTIQLSGQFRPGFEDLQTKMDGSYWFDLAVKKDVLKRRGTVNLRIGDIFCTGRSFSRHCNYGW